MTVVKFKTEPLALYLNSLVAMSTLLTMVLWLVLGDLALGSGPQISPLTLLSLFIIVAIRLAQTCLGTWSKPMSLALLGLVACGNMSSLSMSLLIPDLFLKATPDLVPTYWMTSVGLIIFCLYEVFLLLRTHTQKFYIIDDILLLLVLFPGGLSLLGYSLGVQAYTVSTLDPRSGVSLLEIIFMATTTLPAVLANPNLYLWSFLKQGRRNQIIFAILFFNQYVVAFLVGILFRSPEMSPNDIGLELFVMLSGFLATLLFLIVHSQNESNARATSCN
jgi:hypothetical protein